MNSDNGRESSTTPSAQPLSGNGALQPPFVGACLKLVDTQAWSATVQARWTKIYLALSVFLATCYLVLGATKVIVHRIDWVAASYFIFSAFWLCIAVRGFRIRSKEKRGLTTP